MVMELYSRQDLRREDLVMAIMAQLANIIARRAATALGDPLAWVELRRPAAVVVVC